MKTPTKLKTALFLAAALNVSYAEEKCFPPSENRETIVEVLTCFQSEIGKLTTKTEKQQATINTQQKRITELENAEKAYYFTGSFATPTEWMADVIFNGNYKRFCEAIDKTYVKAQALQDHYQINKGNGHFYPGWYYAGVRYCGSDTLVWSKGNGKPDNAYNIWRYSGKCGCCIDQKEISGTKWTFERSAIIWCK